jgi:acyl carrier protein
MKDLRTVLRSELVARFRVPDSHGDDSGLFSGGLIDSLSVMELVGMVEKCIGCQIPPADITLENFDTVNRILRYAEKLAATRGTG